MLETECFDRVTGVNEAGSLEACGGREINVEKYRMDYVGDGIGMTLKELSRRKCRVDGH